MRQVHNLRGWNLPMVFDHIEIDANNFALMADMYTAVLPTVLNCSVERSDDFIVFRSQFPFFLIRNAKRVANLHIAFGLRSRELVVVAYERALSAKFMDNGQPGNRPDYGDNYYAAFVIDADGNNIEFIARSANHP